MSIHRVKVKPSQPEPARRDDKGSVPANMHHFGSAQGATVVEVSAKGPFALTYVNPADDPRKKSSTP